MVEASHRLLNSHWTDTDSDERANAVASMTKQSVLTAVPTRPRNSA